MAKLKVTIGQKQRELEELQPKYEAMKKQEEACTKEYVILFILTILKVDTEQFLLVMKSVYGALNVAILSGWL